MTAPMARRAHPAHRLAFTLAAAFAPALVLAPPLSAQASNATLNPAPPATLTPPTNAVATIRLGEVYEGVRLRNPKAAAARSLADATRARVPAASLLPDPQLQLSFMNYTLPNLRPMDPTGMATLQLMQMVPTAGKLGFSGRIAAAKAAAERERAVEVNWELRSQAAMAYYEVYEAEQSVAIARETRRLVQDIERIAATMYEVGEGRQADVLRAQVEIARMTEMITRMEAMRVSAVARLNALLDRPVDTPVATALLPQFPGEVPSVDSVAAMASRGRPMIRAGEEEVQAAEGMVELVRRELVPDLVLGLQYGQRSGVMGTERMGSLMVGASIPIWANRRQLKMRDEAAAMRAMAEADLQYMRADTRGKVGVAHAMLTQARNLARLYVTTVLPQAEAAASSAMAAYRVGGVDFMTLLDDRMTVNDYRQELVALHAEEGRAWAELEMLAGRELFDPNTVSLATASGRGGRP
ncbi:MAG TPA: TolC family protein [Gemmatimonadaceae bacterium]